MELPTHIVGTSKQEINIMDEFIFILIPARIDATTILFEDEEIKTIIYACKYTSTELNGIVRHGFASLLLRES